MRVSGTSANHIRASAPDVAPVPATMFVTGTREDLLGQQTL